MCNIMYSRKLVYVNKSIIANDEKLLFKIF